MEDKQRLSVFLNETDSFEVIHIRRPIIKLATVQKETRDHRKTRNTIGTHTAMHLNGSIHSSAIHRLLLPATSLLNKRVLFIQISKSTLILSIVVLHLHQKRVSIRSGFQIADNLHIILFIEYILH